MKKPIIIGHRGHEGKPENTLESFTDAIECGAEMIELDVWLTADRVPVVYHDEFLTSQGVHRGRIAAHTVSALEKLDLPGGAKIPTLEQILIEIAPRVPVNIDLKFFDLNYRPLVGALVNLIRKLKAERKVLVSSFFHQSLEILNREEPRIATAPIFGVPTGAPHPHDLERLASLDSWEGQIGFSRPAAVVDFLMLSESVVTDFKEASLVVLAYTVDEPEDMRKMTTLGVDGIMTKRPSVLREVLNQYDGFT